MVPVFNYLLFLIFSFNTTSLIIHWQKAIVLPNMNNIAYIDGQNLHMGTTTRDTPWKINLARFRVYLQKKYRVSEAYYFLGYTHDMYHELYTEIQKAGFILSFRQHNSMMLGKKKGNVDSDIIFNVMKKLYKLEKFNQIIIVSGDGDYKILVDFLIGEKKFKKILFPDRKFASSLYKRIGSEYFDYLDDNAIKNKIS